MFVFAKFSTLWYHLQTGELFQTSAGDLKPKFALARGLEVIPLISTLFNWFLACALDLKPAQCPEARWRAGLLPTCLLGRWR